MIISKDIKPERDLYYLGAQIISIVGKTDETEFEFFDVFSKLNESQRVSINLYSMVLDWLFLIGAITKNERGNLMRCF